MSDDIFRERFQQLTGHPSLSWQVRLYHRFENNDLPSVIDLPTGLGKTMVMAIWLIARANKIKVPTRLIYVVDRRTVVDQATDLAEEFAYLLAPLDLTEDEQVAERNPKLAERILIAFDSYLTGFEARREGVGERIGTLGVLSPAFAGHYI